MANMLNTQATPEKNIVSHVSVVIANTAAYDMDADSPETNGGYAKHWTPPARHR